MKRSLTVVLCALVACESSDNTVNQVYPDLVVLPESIEFGDVAVNYTLSVPVQVFNAGLAPLDVASIAVSGEGAAAFTVDTAGPLTIAQDEATTVLVTFGPTTYLPFSASLDLASDDPTHPLFSVPLTGVGVATPSPDLVVDPVVLDFEAVEPGDSAVKTVTLRNTGGATLTLGPATQHGSGTFAIVGDDPGGYSIPPGQSQQVVWMYTPTSSVGDNGTWEITSDDPAEPEITVTLLGNGGGDFAYPEADIDCPATIVPRTKVNLDGRGSSDPAGLPLTYAWTMDATPEGSAVDELVDKTLDIANFTPDIGGEYTVGLVVTNSAGVPSARRVCKMDAIPEEELHVELIWNTGAADLDLHLIEGDGEFFSSPADCTWCNTHPDWGVFADPKDDGSYDLDAIRGYGPENINVDAPSADSYRIMVHYFDDHSDGAVIATVRLFAYGELVAELSETMEYSYTWEVGVVNWPEGTLGVTGVYRKNLLYDEAGNPFVDADGNPIAGPKQCTAESTP